MALTERKEGAATPTSVCYVFKQVTEGGEVTFCPIDDDEHGRVDPIFLENLNAHYKARQRMTAAQEGTDMYDSIRFGNGLLFTLEDEDGEEQEFELLAEMEFEDASYLALQPAYENKGLALAGRGEFLVLKRETQDGEMLRTIDDEDELRRVSAVFTERLNAYYEENEEE